MRFLLYTYYTHSGYQTPIFGKNCAYYIRIFTVHNDRSDDRQIDKDRKTDYQNDKQTEKKRGKQSNREKNK